MADSETAATGHGTPDNQASVLVTVDTPGTEGGGSVGTITLNRPKAINALDHEMALAMEQALLGWAVDGEISAAIVREALSRLVADGLVVAEDQRGFRVMPVSRIGRRILGKPADAADALATLRRLSGRTHRVWTAVALASGRRVHFALQVSSVRFTAAPEAELARYVAGGEPFGKAGAYAIQSGAARWIERIEGSHSGIMGLPLYETAVLLRQAGVQF